MTDVEFFVDMVVISPITLAIIVIIWRSLKDNPETPREVKPERRGMIYRGDILNGMRDDQRSKLMSPGVN